MKELIPGTGDLAISAKRLLLKQVVSLPDPVFGDGGRQERLGSVAYTYNFSTEDEETTLLEILGACRSSNLAPNR